MVTVVVGLQWGDEGKGKVVDLLAKRAEVVARCQGGSNADHTVVIDSKRFVFRHIPSACLRPNLICIIGNGCCIDLDVLILEIEGLRKSGVDLKGRLFISSEAHVIMPYHKKIDTIYHQSMGTTGRGVGPCNESKYGRRGIKMRDLLSSTSFKKRLSLNPPVSEEEIQIYLKIGRRLKNYIKDTAMLLNNFIDKGKKVLIEGAQGGLLDIDLGTYPYCTSSNTTAGAACTGLGIAPTKINSIIGVIKAYSTRLGLGLFPTEIFGSVSEEIRIRGNEYFSSIPGQRRRIGWFDVPLVKYMVKINNVDKLALTKLDVLDTLDKIKICIAYKDKKGKLYDIVSPTEASRLSPIFEEIKGWQQSIRGIKIYKNLPQNARRYIEKISTLLEREIFLISTGPRRDDTIILQ